MVFHNGSAIFAWLMARATASTTRHELRANPRDISMTGLKFQSYAATFPMAWPNAAARIKAKLLPDAAGRAWPVLQSCPQWSLVSYQQAARVTWAALDPAHSARQHLITVEQAVTALKSLKNCQLRPQSSQM
jgi:hypothetical protein